MAKAHYAEEFKLEAVRQVTERGYSVPDVSKRLGVSIQSLYKWIKQYSPDATERVEEELREIKKDNLRLKAELRRAQEERDILKKAAAYFARNP